MNPHFQFYTVRWYLFYSASIYELQFHLRWWKIIWTLKEEKTRRTIFEQENLKKMLEKADTLGRHGVSTKTIKLFFNASTDDQLNSAMKQLEGK